MSQVTDPELSGKIKKYWDERAKGTEPASVQATPTTSSFATLRSLVQAKNPKRPFLRAPPLSIGLRRWHAGERCHGFDASLHRRRWSEDMLALARKRCESPGACGKNVIPPGDMRRVDALKGEKSRSS